MAISLPVTVAELHSDPRCIAAQLCLPSGLPVTFRPLENGDAPILGAYFLGLSEDTRRRYAPHPFDQATADQLCAAIDYAQAIRLIAVATLDGQEKVIAYFILAPGTAESEEKRYAGAGIRLDPQSDCTIAPSVADDYQNAGLGSLLMKSTFAIARRLGFRRMVLMGGVQATNERGTHYYQKHGFKTIGRFENPPGFFNYDMIAEIAEDDNGT